MGQVITAVSGTVLVGALIRLWSRSLSRPRRRRKGRDDGTRWRPSFGTGAGFGFWGGGAGGGSGGDCGGGDVAGGGCD